MIKKLNIANQATIKNLEIEPYKINYFFGGNGSGKTTISKFLSDPSNLQNGSIVNDTDSEILVYFKPGYNGTTFRQQRFRRTC